MIKYYNFDIVFQEIPDEVTLAVNITNCPNRCVGCHSPHLQQNIGHPLTTMAIDFLLQRYENEITCFCFMGGDGQVDEIEYLAEHIHHVSELKVAWYSGKNLMPNRSGVFQYIKLGAYIPEKGGLKSSTTNQRLYQNRDGHFVDMTNVFWKQPL